MSDRTAILYRMKLPTHECPYGLLAKRMLEDAGYDIDDRLLTSREQVDAFKEEQDVQTTPQVFIDGERIGGSEELAEYLESVPSGLRPRTLTAAGLLEMGGKPPHVLEPPCLTTLPSCLMSRG